MCKADMHYDQREDPQARKELYKSVTICRNPRDNQYPRVDHQPSAWELQLILSQMLSYLAHRHKGIYRDNPGWNVHEIVII